MQRRVLRAGDVYGAAAGGCLFVVVVYSDSRPRAMTEIMHDTIRDRPEGPLATLSINA